jgi:uncharacterized membrane protein
MDIVFEATWPPMLASFLASFVEFVEALTVVLAVGIVRGWRPALIGTGLGLAVLVALVIALGPMMARIPLDVMQTIIGGLLLLFGLRWLRKAILRAAGILAMHDEEATFAKETATMRGVRTATGLDTVAVTTAFKIVMLEGIEVVFIVIALGATGRMLVPASIGACAALLVVMTLGVLLHRPLARVPENALKFVVGVLLSAFGTFWAGEGIGVEWLGGDAALPALIAGYLIAGILLVPLARQTQGRAA